MTEKKKLALVMRGPQSALQEIRESARDRGIEVFETMWAESEDYIRVNRFVRSPSATEIEGS